MEKDILGLRRFNQTSMVTWRGLHTFRSTPLYQFESIGTVEVRHRTSVGYQSVVEILETLEKLIHEVFRLCLGQFRVLMANNVREEVPAGAKL